MPEDYKISAQYGGKKITGGPKVNIEYGKQPPRDVMKDSERLKRVQAEGGRGDFRRLEPGDMQKYREGWDRIFGKKK